MNSSGIEVGYRRSIASRLKLLRKLREDADYRPGRTVDRQIANECLKDARRVLLELGIKA